MSHRREDRTSESRRHRSRFNREPSPKRSRRDGKPEAERASINAELDKDRLDRDRRHHRRLQDPLPLEAPSAQDLKVETGNGSSKESEKKPNEHQGGSKHSSDPTKVPHSRSYFQHEDRGSARQSGRSFSRRTDSERGWRRDPKDQQIDREPSKTLASDAQRNDGKAKDNREDSHVWHQDGYYKMEANAKPPEHKRPSFREQKIPREPEKADKAATGTPNAQDHIVESGRRTDRGYTSRQSDKPDKPFGGERDRGNFSSRDRYGANSRYRGNDRFGPRQEYHPTEGRAEKWKHDLYDEANKSPPPKNEEDQISKIEALLAS